MGKDITEDNIEQALLNRLEAAPFNYDVIHCDPSLEAIDILPDGTGRDIKEQCVLPEVLFRSLVRINPSIDPKYIKEVVNDLKAINTRELNEANYNFYTKLREGIRLEIFVNGKKEYPILHLIDYENPYNNTFTAVSQMWIKSTIINGNPKRPDVIIFVNGMPLVFIELKNAIVSIKNAYSVNLKKYLKETPNLFVQNQICVLSNGLETKVGAYSADYEHFFKWLKVNNEKEVVDQRTFNLVEDAKDCSIKYFIDGLLPKDRLIDYIENFIVYDNKTTKIIAKNHQYLGVNNLFKAVENRKELNGKLGVFWHTQGSGKSYSMVMFARKVKRKLQGDFSFVAITDREDLDTQLYKNFERTGVISEGDACQPKNSSDLQNMLSINKSFVFSLIQKFRYDKNKKYPVLSTRDDIIVMVDEAHRTQYKDLAENMRTALPNASYVAFTGTPLLGSKRLTNQWFGNYVSEYNFTQAVEDGATVPIYYAKHLPEVGLQNDFLDEDLEAISEQEDLNSEEQRRLENNYSRIIEVIKRDDRLDKVARDIAHHFPRRGFLGKGMVVSVDKFTAVRMYDKVKHYLEIEKRQLMAERNKLEDKNERKKIDASLEYINNMDMAVIISQENDENEKFKAEGLEIKAHREKMNAITAEGLDIEDRFKDPRDSLQLVFVCAMWLTGFDVKSLSTLYLDKPMKGHTLMQAVARVNRVYPNKECGLIVDYVNVFKYMKKALSDYAGGADGTDFPVKDMEQLILQIEATLIDACRVLLEVGIDADEIAKLDETFDKLEYYKQAYDTILLSTEKERIKVVLNTLVSLYDAAKPEIFEWNWHDSRFPFLSYLQGLLANSIDDEKINRAKLRVNKILDQSVVVKSGYITGSNDEGFDYLLDKDKVLDLSKIDMDELRKEFQITPYKGVLITNLEDHMNKILSRMIGRNCTRKKFSERFNMIIDSYNAGSENLEEYYDKLMEFMEELTEEDTRSKREGLREGELEIFDLLSADRKLNKDEEQKVKLSARALYKKLTEEKDNLLVVDWYKDEQTKSTVRTSVEKTLDETLPPSFDKPVFEAKVSRLMERFTEMASQGYGWIGSSNYNSASL